MTAWRLYILSTGVAGKDSNTSSTQSWLPGNYTFCQQVLHVKTATLALHNKEWYLVSQNLASSHVWPDADHHARASAGCQEQSSHTGLLPHKATACTGLDVSHSIHSNTPWQQLPVRVAASTLLFQHDVHLVGCNSWITCGNILPRQTPGLFVTTESPVAIFCQGKHLV